MLIFSLSLLSPTASDGPMTLKQHLLKLDPLGFIISVPSIINVRLALKWRDTKYAWSYPIIIALESISTFSLSSISPHSFGSKKRISSHSVSPDSAPLHVPCSFCLQQAALSRRSRTTYRCGYRQSKAPPPNVNVLSSAITTIVGSIYSGLFTLRLGYYIP